MAWKKITIHIYSSVNLLLVYVEYHTKRIYAIKIFVVFLHTWIIGARSKFYCCNIVLPVCSVVQFFFFPLVLQVILFSAIVVAFFIYLAAFLLWMTGKLIYSSDWVTQIRVRRSPFSELESVSITNALLLLCKIFLRRLFTWILYSFKVEQISVSESNLRNVGSERIFKILIRTVRIYSAQMCSVSQER